MATSATAVATTAAAAMTVMAAAKLGTVDCVERVEGVAGWEGWAEVMEEGVMGSAARGGEEEADIPAEVGRVAEATVAAARAVEGKAAV